ncbi:MAG: ammonium transporter [Methanomassiliicoccales archaeon]|jgi:Amt family ammonium transporter
MEDGEQLALIDSGDTAWMLISTALVFIMTPAVGFFYGGMLRKQNMLSILGQSIIIIGMVTLIWITVGFSLAFGAFKEPLIGNFDWFMLKGIGGAPIDTYASTIPGILYMMFQGMFAIITVALIIGGLAERMKLKALITFLFIWTFLVYIPVAHWVWGGGWLAQIGALDFAGGTVVHITAGVSVLAGVLVLGKRTSLNNGTPETPHNIPFVVLGGALLWIGWFGFNGGSALTSGALAANAFVVTMVAASTAAVVWGLVNYFHLGRPGVLGMISGAIAGLVAITPASGFVDVSGAIAIGIGAGIFCYGGILVRKRFGFDDALDVWGVHGIGGTWGALATGLFATSAVNPAVVNNGVAYGGGFTLLGAQLIAVAAVWAFAFSITFVVMHILKRTMTIRMTKEEERIGADIIQHGENAYS